MAEMIGEFFHNKSEFAGEWQIPDFLSLPEKTDKGYHSGEFSFSGACWELELYPHGESDEEPEGWVGIYLFKRGGGPPLTVDCSLGVRKADGTEEIRSRIDNYTFNKRVDFGWSEPKCLERDDLVHRRAVLVPSDILTITCNMKIARLHSMDVALCRRLWNSSSMLRILLYSEEGTDVTLKFEDGDLRAHAVILKARSKVFDRMFTSVMLESRPEVNIPGANWATFRIVLDYAYTGDPKGLSSKNVCSVYEIANKYDLEELSRLCVECMKYYLSLRTVCDFIELAELYEETVLKDSAIAFFSKNAVDVMKTEKWKTLKKNPSIVIQLLERIVMDRC